MYGISTYIYHKNKPSVCKYTIHGSYGHSHVKPWHTSTCVDVLICVAGAISPGISVQSCDFWMDTRIQHMHKHSNYNDLFFGVNRRMLPNLHPCWCEKTILSFKDALNARTQAVSCQSHNSPQIWDLASVKGPRCNMKEKTSNVKHFCKRTHLLIVSFSTAHVDKNAPSLNWIIFPNLLRLKKNFRLSRSAPTGWVSSQPGLTKTNCPSSRQAMKKSAYQDWFQSNKPLTAPM